jgi:hypothetical protein
VKILCLSFRPAISCAYAPGYIQTFVSRTLFDLSNRKSLKNSTFVSCSVLTDFCQYLCLPLYRFLLSSFDHGTFGKVATVVFAIYVVVLSCNLKQIEDWLYVMLALILLTLCLDAQKWFLELNWVGIPNSWWKGNDLQFKFCCLDDTEFAIGITEWYPFPIPVWM